MRPRGICLPSAASALAFPVIATIVFCVGGFIYFDSFYSGFSGPDESAHFVNSYFFHDLFRNGREAWSINFAVEYYQSYPKLSIAHWPPLYYVVVGAIFLLTDASPVSAMYVTLVVAVLIVSMSAVFLHRRVDIWWIWFFCALYWVSPIGQYGLKFFMLDQPLTLVCVIAVIVWGRYERRPTLGNALLYTGCAIAAIMVKGNGWIIGIYPILQVALGSKWYIMRTINTYIMIAVTVVLIVPWYYVTYRISSEGFSYDFGFSYIRDSIVFYSIIIKTNIGPVGIFLSIVCLFGWILGYSKRDALNHIIRASVGMVASVLILQSAIPVDLSSRYYMPAMPFTGMLVMGGLVQTADFLDRFLSRRYRNACLAVLVVAVLWPGAQKMWEGKPLIDFRMAEAAEMVLGGGGERVVLVDGSANGEGALIAEAIAVRQGDRDVVIVRSSKILADSDFMGEAYTLRFDEIGEIQQEIGELAPNFVVVERAAGGKFYQHNELLLKALRADGSRFRLVKELPHGNRDGTTLVFENIDPAQPNLEKARAYNMPDKVPSV